MFSVKAHWDSSAVNVSLAKIGKQLPFAFALAATRTAQAMHAAEKRAMHADLDRPTAWSLNSLYLTPATKARPSARVWFKDQAAGGTPAGKYLMPQVHSGGRKPKRIETRLAFAAGIPRGTYLLPTSNVERDAFGNVRRNVYSKILSSLRQRNTANAEGRSGGSARIFGRMINGRWGIWERKNFGAGSGLRALFVQASRPNYRTRFAFFDVGDQVARSEYAGHMRDALAHAIATAR